MADSTYSVPADMLLGDLPVAVSVNKQKYVNDAADEVDSIIGVRYATPLDVSDTGTIPRYARLFIKRVANNLATGRLILAVAAGGEDNQIHAYGWSLIQTSLDALKQIADGTYDIVGADPADPDATTRVTGPAIAGGDATSGVDAFYGLVSVYQPPGPVPLLVGPRWEPGGR